MQYTLWRVNCHAHLGKSALLGWRAPNVGKRAE